MNYRLKDPKSRCSQQDCHDTNLTLIDSNWWGLTKVMHPNSQWAPRKPRSPQVETQRYFSLDLHPPICSVFGVVQCGLDAAVCLHVLVHLRGHEGPRVLIREGLALAVGALGAQVCAVRHLILLHRWTNRRGREKPVTLQIHTDLVWTGKKCHIHVCIHVHICVKRGARIRSINMQNPVKSFFRKAEQN